jgi:aspartyl-tRNA(Asn)/glutamyl-tRNA(Gln) amidotransferase subunit A
VRRAGGIVVGKTTTPEFAHKVLTDSPVSGVTRNPWSLAHSPGGSSGGAGVAAAMGFASLNVATDGAGSSRVPASCCGVFGLKPTMGRIPNEASPDAFGLQVIGLVARSVDDLRLLLRTLEGPLDDDPLSFGRRSDDDAVARLAGLRVRWLPRMGNALVAADVRAACERTLAMMTAAGAQVDDAPSIDWAHDACRILLRAQQASRFRALTDAERALLDPGFRACIDEGLAQRSADLQDALLERTALLRRVRRLLDGADVLASPVVATPALAATQAPDAHVVVDGRDGGSLREGWYCYTVPFNATGHPAVAIPCGFDREGLPIGLQLVGPWHRDDRLLQLAQAIASLVGLPDRWPALASRAQTTAFQA